MSDCMTQEDAMNMDNEQAIQILRPFMNMMRDQNGCPISSAYFALGKAIEALEHPRMLGKWKTFGWNGVYCECSECGNVYSYHFNFCPHCGADMRGTE